MEPLREKPVETKINIEFILLSKPDLNDMFLCHGSLVLQQQEGENKGEDRSDV